jgi:hypothetical protein
MSLQSELTELDRSLTAQLETIAARLQELEADVAQIQRALAIELERTPR